MSFDVGSLFTNVPIDAAAQAALQKLENDLSLADRTTLTPAQIADLLTFVLRSTYFHRDNGIEISEAKDAHDQETQEKERRTIVARRGNNSPKQRG